MRAIRTLDASNLTIGIAGLGWTAHNRPGSVREMVHDGDTLNVRADGDIGVRLLGIDTPEVSSRLPGQGGFASIGGEKWDEFLSNPFDPQYGEFDQPLEPGLRRWFDSRIGPGRAAVHHRHAKFAEAALEAEIARDMRVLEQSPEQFRFFMAFAFEVMDGYGRFLCYVNRDQPDRDRPAPRPLTYNERLLEQGRAVPYFIWPNVNPFRKADSTEEAVLRPGTAKQTADDDKTLSRAREWMRAARANHAGIFDALQPLDLEPFELRLLARREAPRRWVIDLSRNDNVLVPPQRYFEIPHPEDRLFVPAEFVPLFAGKGWRRG